MKKLISAFFVLGFSLLNSTAQVEGTEYYLPKTEIRFQLLVEKTTHTPGEFAMYAERFLKRRTSDKPSVNYRLVGINMYTTAIPDSAKNYVVPMGKKHIILNVERAKNGILLAINTKGKTAAEPTNFVPSKKQKPVNPHDYMSEDILASGSKAKMAELTAREIYEIRNSRNELTRGEADFMPKDGEQLKIMLANLDRQEAILLQTFQGREERDTTQYEVVFCPNGKAGSENNGNEKALLFRFSQRLGLLDNDDLAGAPYYINIENLNIIPELRTAADNEKPSKDPGIKVNMPGKIKATIFEGNNQIKTFELYAAQFGRLEELSANLFSKKMLTKLQLNPITGNIEHIESEPLN